HAKFINVLIKLVICEKQYRTLSIKIISLLNLKFHLSLMRVLLQKKSSHDFGLKLSLKSKSVFPGGAPWTK
ncbi:hypothetical protein BpHYR1_052387, partial [Brachionus plicatilis]